MKEDITLFDWLESTIFDRNKKEIESFSEEEIKKMQVNIKKHKLNIEVEIDCE